MLFRGPVKANTQDMSARLPPELWSRIIRIYVSDWEFTNGLGPIDWYKPPVTYGICESVGWTLRKSAYILASVCKLWRELVLSDPHLKFRPIRGDCFRDLYPEKLTANGPEVSMQIAIRKGGTSASEAVDIRDVLIPFAGRLESLSLTLYSDEETNAVFHALGTSDFIQLRRLEIVHGGLDVKFHMLEIRRLAAPCLTTLILCQVDIFQNDTKDFRDFLSSLKALTNLQHLDLSLFTHYYDVREIVICAPQGYLPTEVIYITKLKLHDMLLRHLHLPNLEQFELSTMNWNERYPDEGWYSPGFDLPKLSRLSPLNLATARILSFARHPELRYLSIYPVEETTCTVQVLEGLVVKELTVALPKLQHLGVVLLATAKDDPFRMFLSRCCSTSLTSLCLTSLQVSRLKGEKFLNASPDSFCNVRVLTIQISEYVVDVFGRNALNSVCPILSGVVNLQLFFQLIRTDTSLLNFPTPSPDLIKPDGAGKMRLLPNLQTMLLAIRIMGGAEIPDWTFSRKNLKEVESFVKKRSSARIRFSALVFSHPIEDKAEFFFKST